MHLPNNLKNRRLKPRVVIGGFLQNIAGGLILVPLNRLLSSVGSINTSYSSRTCINACIMFIGAGSKKGGSKSLTTTHQLRTLETFHLLRHGSHFACSHMG